ncbi:polycystin family receptor for egg jelly-like [Pelodytes ibericus]
MYIADEIYTIYTQKKRYLCISNGLNVVLKALAFFAFILQVAKFILASALLNLYTAYPKQFIPFYVASNVDIVFRKTLGFLAFCVVLKSLRYASFVYDIRLAQRSIMAAFSSIFSMGLVFIVCFIAYSSFGYLVFGQYEWNYSSFQNSVQTILSYCVSSFGKTVFSNNLFLGVLYLCSFLFAMIFIVINLFQAVILSTYEYMKQPIYEDPSEEAEVIAFLGFKIKRFWTLLTGRQPKKCEHDSLVGILYGHSQKLTDYPLGLKTKECHNKKTAILWD